MSGIPVQCGGCSNEERCCQLDFIDVDDRDWREWIGDMVFSPIMWTLLASGALGLAGLLFYVGIWGFTSGIDLLQI